MRFSNVGVGVGAGAGAGALTAGFSAVRRFCWPATGVVSSRFERINMQSSGSLWGFMGLPLLRIHHSCVGPVVARVYCLWRMRVCNPRSELDATRTNARRAHSVRVFGLTATLDLYG